LISGIRKRRTEAVISEWEGHGEEIETRKNYDTLIKWVIGYVVEKVGARKYSDI
jgi:hypothetical protein